MLGYLGLDYYSQKLCSRMSDPITIPHTKSWADEMDDSDNEVDNTIFIPAAASPSISRHTSDEKEQKIPRSMPKNKKEEILTDLRERLVFIVGTQGFTEQSLIAYLKTQNCNPILLWCLPDRDPIVGLRPFAHAVFNTKEEAEQLITRAKIIVNPNQNPPTNLDFRIFEPLITNQDQNPRDAKVLGHVTENELRTALKHLDEPSKIRRIRFGKQTAHILTFTSSIGASIAIRRLNHYKTVRGTLTAEYGKNINV